MFARVLRVVQRTPALTRAFSAEAAAAAPKYDRLQINSHTGRMAGEIFDTAMEQEMDVKDVLESLQDIRDEINDDRLLKMFLEDATIKLDDKADTLHELYLRMEEEDEECFVDELAEDTIELLLETKDLNSLDDICNDLHRIVLEDSKEIEATVTSAEALTEAQEDAVYEKLSALAPGKTVLVDFDIDTSLIGGLTVNLGDQFQDLSVRAALMSAESALRTL
mmetsp:Transcript_9629/g.14028  ORF Transcript_9629/g.14028 Transcript_9629/m.14028 type:complete len:222 (-) Transcript_9629:144-809(-)|eukprot:CAMPEP_0175127302 /NCGR_PEP_ID=MMETSP0087-20121206/4317_1 /TAXON_ID=136419 /ORGANISM="Unknown Unknown, Strain D1" /LENGTH=221 /DNA_ID=CAMNT_0016409277 /DNA_START=35 /DNA_END=700 /DNA_ORIENTATION=-